MKPSYEEFTVDLATPREAPGLAIVPTGRRIVSVAVTEAPAGAVWSLALGANAAPIRVTDRVQSIQIADGCNCLAALDEGLYVINPAGAGTVRFVVRYADGGR